MLELRPEGLYCPAGDFYVDPWRPVERAVITHAHSDHARFGSKAYLTANSGVPVLRARLGEEASIRGIAYGEPVAIGEARVTLFPAGHILGSSQVRIEVGGRIWVVTGDYKTEPDGSCDPFEPVRAHGLVTEATFGLPIYRWRPQSEVLAEILAWYEDNRARKVTCVLTAYALGKAQRLLHALAPYDVPVVVHGAVASMNRAYEAAGVSLGRWSTVSEGRPDPAALVLCPPSATATPWLRRFGDVELAFVSGWMTIRGIRRRRAVDRGFVMSDHVDWPSLLAAVEASGAETVWTTHGYADPVARYLQERGLDAHALRTEFAGEEESGA